MATDLRTELNEFYAFLGRQLHSDATVSPEEALDAWRRGNPDDQLHADNVRALKALRDMELGDDGVPLDDFDREFRQKHSISPDAC